MRRVPASSSAIVIEAYGARMAVHAADADVMARIVDELPAGWAPAASDVAPDDVEWRFGIEHDENGGFRVQDGDGQVTRCGEIEVAIGLLKLYLRRFVGYHTRDLVFVHAGVVAHEGRAIVIPGHSFSGKTTLVAALVRAGATYYSDEYALFGDDGLVRPYREAPAMRDQAGVQTGSVSIESLGGTSGNDPVPVGLVLITSYVPGASWAPTRITPMQGLLAMMEHTLPARDRPEQTLSVLKKGLESAIVLSGERGDADATAEAVLATQTG